MRGQIDLMNRMTPIVMLAIALFATSGTRAQDASPHAIDIPPWFALSFLDFRDDIAEAKRDHKRLLVYFGQDGCPYCAMLMETNFSQRSIVEKTRGHFVTIALNLWGDRPVTWIDGRTMTEKELGRVLNVQFTPTLLFFDERGKVVVRQNGYSPPQRFEAVLDYVAARQEERQTLADYLGTAAKEPASPHLHGQAFFLKPPFDLRRPTGGKPLAVIFETIDCSGCDEMHRDVFSRPDVLAQIGRFDVVRLSLGGRAELTTPDGRTTTPKAWARALGVSYTPTIVLFDGAAEVLRIEAYVRPFHFASAFDYVASGAYLREPSFQRYIQTRADAMRARGERVDIVE